MRVGFALDDRVLGGKPASTILSQVSVLGQGCGSMAESLLSMPKAWSFLATLSKTRAWDSQMLL